jgi:four helix bundle protein
MVPYERFDAWKAAHEFTLAVYRESNGWPRDERFGLTSQARRAAHSVSANIVEGQARRGRKEFRRFLDIAWGSLAEAGYTIRLARDLGIVAEPVFLELERLRSEVGKPLYGLLRSMGEP